MENNETSTDIMHPESTSKTKKIVVDDTRDLLKSTPTFPEEVDENLPDLLADCIKHFTDARERDIVLTSSLVILSGCFSSCKGKYSNDWVGPNLYCFIVAPPASAKGSMKFARILGKTIQDNFTSANAKAKQDYESKTKIWSKTAKKSTTDAGDPPVKPKYPIHFIPGNSSAASIYKILDESNGKGTICESEADTLTGAIKQDWGNFSHLLRSAFQHEELSMSRSSNDVNLLISQPHLPTLLTGTPEQVPRLIASAENGLSSRFLFYCYAREIEWLDPTPCTGCADLSAYFQDLSVKVDGIKGMLDAHKNAFSLTDDQFSKLSANFKRKLQRVKDFDGEGAVSSVYRLGLIAFRIAMILTNVRKSKDLATTKNLICTDQDFETTMKLTDVYFEHSMVMYSLLPKQTKKGINPRIARFYSLLPKDEKFPRNKANKIGESIGISEKTVGNYLTELKEDGHILCPTHGNFEVVNLT